MTMVEFMKLMINVAGNEHTTIMEDKQFFYDCDDDCIYYTNIRVQSDDEVFMQYIQKKYPEGIIFNVMVWSFLHELGHVETDDLMVDDIEERQALYDRSAKGENIMPLYMELWNEKIATSWAIGFVKNNYEKIKEYYDMVTEW